MNQNHWYLFIVFKDRELLRTLNSLLDLKWKDVWESHASVVCRQVAQRVVFSCWSATIHQPYDFAKSPIQEKKATIIFAAFGSHEFLIISADRFNRSAVEFWHRIVQMAQYMTSYSKYNLFQMIWQEEISYWFQSST